MASLPGSLETHLTAALAAVGTATGIGTLWPGTLNGPAAMNGSAKGTALVVLVVAVPLLLASWWRAATGSLRARAVWLGAVAYLLYNAVMFCFATPFNRMFLVYVAMLGLAVATLAAGLALTPYARVDERDVPARGVAAYLWTIVALNTALWLSTVVPALYEDPPPEFLDGSGLITFPTFVQDLAFWLPAMAVVGYGLWQRRPWGVFLAPAGLVFWFVEAVGVAVDQWWGSRADPDSTVVSASVVPGFVVLALVTLVPLWFSLRWRQVEDPDMQQGPRRSEGPAVVL
jgi:hypothetical protein